MATEVCSASPRISFSHDLSQADLSSSPASSRRMDRSLPLDPAAPTADGGDDDFDFSISRDISFADDPSPADELFSGGKLLPLPLPLPVKSPAPAAAAASSPPRGRGSLRAVMLGSDDDDGCPNHAAATKKVAAAAAAAHRSFWRFGRSSSVGDSHRAAAGTVCPFPRSKSTGSYPINTTNVKHHHHHQAQDAGGISNVTNPAVLRKAAKAQYYYSGSRRGAYGSGVRISPVLNLPGPFIPRGGAAGIFGYLTCRCGEKSMKRGGGAV